MIKGLPDEGGPFFMKRVDKRTWLSYSRDMNLTPPMVPLTYSMSKVCIPVERFWGMDIVFLPGSKEYRLTDVNGRSYFEETPERLKVILKGLGKRHLRTYLPRRAVD